MRHGTGASRHMPNVSRVQECVCCVGVYCYLVCVVVVEPGEAVYTTPGSISPENSEQKYTSNILTVGATM